MSYKTALLLTIFQPRAGQTLPIELASDLNTKCPLRCSNLHYYTFNFIFKSNISLEMMKNHNLGFFYR